jgi:hypothetical protein
MFNISRQAYLYTIILLLTSFVNMIIFSYLYGFYGFFSYIISFLIFTPFLLLSIYNIDCLTTGGCNVWSWVVSIMSTLGLVITTIGMIVLSYMNVSSNE